MLRVHPLLFAFVTASFVLTAGCKQKEETRSPAAVEEGESGVSESAGGLVEEATEVAKESADEVMEKAEEVTKAATETAEEASKVAKDTATEAQKEVKALLDKATEAIKGGKLDEAEAPLKQAEGMKSTLPEADQKQVEEARKAFDAAKEAQGLKDKLPKLPE